MFKPNFSIGRRQSLANSKHKSADIQGRARHPSTRTLKNSPRTVWELIVAALSLEAEKPGEAVKLYQRAKKKKQRSSKLILIVSLTSPVLASILALHISSRSGRFSAILSAGILIYIGFGLPAMLRELRDYRRAQLKDLFRDEESTKPEPQFPWLSFVLAGPFFTFQHLLLSLAAAFLVIAAMWPLLAILLLFEDLQWRVIYNPYLLITLEVFSVTVGCLSLLAVLADLVPANLWPPISGVKILFASVWANFRDVLEYSSVLVAGYFFVSLGLGDSVILASSSYEAVIGGMLSGLFLAPALSRDDFPDEEDAFITLGICRCQLRLQHWSSAHALLIEISKRNTCESLNDDPKQLCEGLTNYLVSLARGIRFGYPPGEIEERIAARADEVIEPDLPNRATHIRARRETWNKNIKLTRSLVEDKVLRNALDRAARRRRLLEKYHLDEVHLHFFMLYYLAGAMCFLWWMFRVLSR